MALVADPRVVVNFYLRDSGNNPTTRSYELASGVLGTDTVETYTDAALDLWAALDPLTLAAVENVQVVFNVRNDDLLIPAAGQVEEAAEVSVPLDGRPNRRATFSIPAPIIALFVAATGDNANVVAVDNPDLTTFLNFFDPDTGGFMVSDGEQIDSAVAKRKGKRVHYRSRRG